ncbi:unnamed protein product [Lathyrus oleraceus]
MEDVPKFYSNNLNDSVDVNLSNEVVTNLLDNLTSKAVKGDSRIIFFYQPRALLKKSNKSTSIDITLAIPIFNRSIYK